MSRSVEQALYEVGLAQRQAAASAIDAAKASKAGPGGWLFARRHQRDSAIFYGRARRLYAEYLDAVERDRWAHLHVITDRADGPDLDDLVRLIRYCREHGVTLSSGQTMLLASEMERPCPVILRLYGRTESTVIVEGDPLPEAHFVGPDGTVYDCNREAL